MTKQKFDVGTASVGELVAEFSNLAREKGCAIRPGAPLIDRRPEAEKEAFRTRGRELIRALRERAAIDDVRPLFESADDDVRGFAASALDFFDEELAAAAFSGVLYGVPTVRTLQLTRSARSLDSTGPLLDRMTEDELYARFIDVASRIYATRFFDWLGDDGEGVAGRSADTDNRNHWIREEVLVLRELKSRGALARVLPLLDDPNPVIRAEAAIACLALATDRAVAILEDRARHIAGYGAESLEASEAKDALRNWRAGKAVIWDVV
jgi:HEAT repeat protein